MIEIAGAMRVSRAGTIRATDAVMYASTVRIDGEDGAVLGWALRKENPQRGKAALAIAAVAPVIALDILCGKELGLS